MSDTKLVLLLLSEIKRLQDTIDKLEEQLDYVDDCFPDVWSWATYDK